MIMEGILKNWRGFIKEGVTPEGKIQLKYYAFDWDDNLLKMPTKIIFNDVDVDPNTNEETVKGQVFMSTHDFAEYRSKIGKPFEFEGKTVNLRYLPNDNSFINFRDNPKANSEFIAQATEAPIPENTSAWNAFVEAVNSASFFAIITARGHSPNTLKMACYNVIMSNRDGINSDDLYKNFNYLRKLVGEPIIENKSEAIMRYLSDGLNDEGKADGTSKNCQFSPVSHSSISGAAGAANPEALKEQQFRKFSDRMKKKASLLRSKNREAINSAQQNNQQPPDTIPGEGDEIINKGFLDSEKFSIGFSDDDRKNAEHMAKVLKGSPTATVFHTAPTGTSVLKGKSGQR